MSAPDRELYTCDTTGEIFPCGECPGCIPQDMRTPAERPTGADS